MNILIKKTFLAVAVLGMLVMSSCDSYLDIYDPSPATMELLDTKDGQEKLLVTINARFRSVFGNYYLQDFGTDMYIGCDESPTVTQFNAYSDDLSGLSPLIDGYWQLLYKIIQESNVLLNRCTPEVAGNDYAALTAKTRFFRAMAYYYLVETYGPVPLLTEENTDPDNLLTEVTREPEEKIYDFMVTELSDIEGVLKEKTAVNEISNTAVKQFLGKVLLTRAYRAYAQPDDLTRSIAYFEDIINSKNYNLLGQFSDVFDEENQANNEIIYSIQYGTDKNYYGGGNPLHAMYCFNLIALYTKGFALNPADYPAAQRDIWTNPIVHQWFRDPVADKRYDATFKREFYYNDPADEELNGKLGLYFPRWNDESGDTKGAAYFFPYKNGDGDYNWYPALPAMGWTADAMPMCQKFKLTKIKWGDPGTREDVVMRKADTYLLCAEAYLLKGDAQSAMDLVNVILRRAAGNEEDYEKIKISNASELTLDRLLEERGCEMFGEHDRWFDLKRTGKLLERALLNPQVVHYDNISEKNLVRPIPYSETIKVKGLTQNSGYRN